MGEIIRKTVKIGEKPTAAQIEEVNVAKAKPANFDDIPEFSYDEMLEMAEMAKLKREEQKKEVVTLRVSAAALKKAKSVGKGYTGFLGRLIENALNDKDIVARSL